MEGHGTFNILPRYQNGIIVAIAIKEVKTKFILIR